MSFPSIGWLCAPALALCVAASGCVWVYQPMSGLQQPVVVDPQVRNFEDVRLTVRCVPGDALSAQNAGMLCQRVGTLFENQGATVRTFVAASGAEGDPLDADDEAEAEVPEEAPTDLVMELRARRLHRANDPVSWALCIVTFTLVPGVTESTFRQEVVIRDETGFLLASQSLEGRIVRRFGAGPWIGNKVLDLVWRDRDEELTGRVVYEDLSGDMYRQLSQLLFNAKMHRQVLLEAAWR